MFTTVRTCLGGSFVPTFTRDNAKEWSEKGIDNTVEESTLIILLNSDYFLKAGGMPWANGKKTGSGAGFRQYVSCVWLELLT